MEEPVHYLMLLLLQFDGSVVKDIVNFISPMTLRECLEFADSCQQIISTHEEFGLTGQAIDQGWYLNDESGTWQGSMCFQDPDRIK